jgi:ATP-binding cassette subfamily C protein CydC
MMMRDLYPFIALLSKHARWVILGLILSLLTVIAAVGLLAVSGWFISAAAYAGLSLATAAQFNYLIPGASVRLLAYVRILGRYSERLVTHEATFRILADLRVWFFERLEPLAPGYLLYHRSGDLLNRAVHDIDALDNLYLRVLTPSLVALLLALILAALLSFFSLSLAFSVLGLFLFSAIGVSYIAMHLAGPTGAQLLLTTAVLRTQMIDFIQGLGELLVWGAQQPQRLALQQQNKTLLQLQKKMGYLRGLNAAFMILMSGISVLIGLYLSAGLVLAGQLNGAYLAFIVLAILASFEVIAPLPLAYQYWGKTRQAARRLLEIAQTEPTILFPTHSKQQPLEASLCFKNVCFAYPQSRSPLLNHFNLTILAGEQIAITGASGVGKSTLLHLIARFIDPLEGSIEIGSVSHQTLSESDLRQQMCLISQRPHLFNASLRANLLIANPQASDAELWQALDIVQLKAFVESLPEGLETFAGEGDFRFSGGQTRRFALARAVLQNAPIWLLDEPTEGLDRPTEQALWLTLEPLLKNRTVLLCTHSRRYLNRMDRVLRLEQGEILYC